MRAGRLNKLVMLQQKTDAGATDPWGNPVAPFADVRNVYASIDPVSLATLAGASETVLAGSETQYDLVRIEMHPQLDVAPLTWRVLYGEQIYDVKAARLNNKGDRGVLICTVGASNG